MQACMEENGMSFDEEVVEELTRALYQDAVSQQQPGITYSSLKSQILKHEGLIENLTIRYYYQVVFQYCRNFVTDNLNIGRSTNMQVKLRHCPPARAIMMAQFRDPSTLTECLNSTSLLTIKLRLITKKRMWKMRN